MHKVLLSLVLLLSSSAAIANVDQEIAHLLNYVQTTDCHYNRNGTDYNGAEAREHIQKKYDYYRDKIKTTEDFIQYSATKSMISGKKYTVICPSQESQFSTDWLKNELHRYRSQLIE